MSFIEGQRLGPGLRITLTKGYPEPVFMCACGRMQTASIGPENAEHYGWRQIHGEWHCPFCTGNTKNLEAAFEQAKEQQAGNE